MIGDGGRRWWLQIGEMESEKEDGGWSGSSKGDRVHFVSKENKRKKNEGILGQKIKDTGPMDVCIKRGLRPSKKNVDISVKNAA